MIKKTKVTKKAKTAKKSAPCTRISKTMALKKIAESGGRFFTVTCTTQAGKLRSFNAKFNAPRRKTRARDVDKMLGYITVYDLHKKALRRVNAQTIKTLNINKQSYKIN